MERVREEQRALTIASPRLDQARSPNRMAHSTGAETDPPRETPRPPGVPLLVASPTLPAMREAPLPSARVRIPLFDQPPPPTPPSIWLDSAHCLCHRDVIAQSRDRSPDPKSVRASLAVMGPQSARGPSPSRAALSPRSPSPSAARQPSGKSPRRGSWVQIFVTHVMLCRRCDVFLSLCVWRAILLLVRAAVPLARPLRLLPK